jgi:polygalacturonase
MSGGVRNIFAVNNYSVKEVNMALFIKSSRLRGGTVENVYINDLTMNRANGEVISIVPNYDQADNKPYPPVFKNIQVQNLTCDTSKAGILIHGWYDEPVKNVYFQSLDLNSVSQKPMEVNQALNVHFNNVQINDTTYNKELNRHEKGEKPPEKI